jgi:hypothetical protein
MLLQLQTYLLNGSSYKILSHASIHPFSRYTAPSQLSLAPVLSLLSLYPVWRYFPAHRDWKYAVDTDNTEHRSRAVPSDPGFLVFLVVLLVQVDLVDRLHLDVLRRLDYPDFLVVRCFLLVLDSHLALSVPVRPCHQLLRPRQGLLSRPLYQPHQAIPVGLAVHCCLVDLHCLARLMVRHFLVFQRRLDYPAGLVDQDGRVDTDGIQFQIPSPVAHCRVDPLPLERQRHLVHHQLLAVLAPQPDLVDTRFGLRIRTVLLLDVSHVEQSLGLVQHVLPVQFLPRFVSSTHGSRPFLIRCCCLQF